MKIIITGGAGFVGANLAFYLSEKGNNVTVMDNLARRGSENNLDLFKEKGIEYIHGDIRNPEDFPRGNFDFLLECSAQPSAIDGYNNPSYDFTNNTLGLFNTLEFCRKNGIALIFWSTNKVYSGDKINSIPLEECDTRYVFGRGSIPDKGFDPVHGFSNDFSVDGGQHSIYGMTKIMSDIACQEYYDAYELPTIVNRFSCLAGERQWGKCAQGWVAWWSIAAHFGLPLKYIGWKGKQVRDVLFVEDICHLIELEMENIDKIKGQVFNVGGGHKNTISLIEATKIVEDIFNVKMEIVYEEGPRKADHCVYISDIRKIKKYTGWAPKIGILEGYEKISKWVKDNENILKRLYL